MIAKLLARLTSARAAFADWACPDRYVCRFANDTDEDDA